MLDCSNSGLSSSFSESVLMSESKARAFYCSIVANSSTVSSLGNGCSSSIGVSGGSLNVFGVSVSLSVVVICKFVSVL
jgi:hypothetical protein